MNSVTQNEKRNWCCRAKKSLGINFQQHFHSTGGGEYPEKLFFGRKIEVKKASPFSSKDEIKHAERRMTSTNRHHIILFHWTWRMNCIYPPVRKKSIVFPNDKRFELLWSDSKFSYHISIKEYTKFFAYIVCLDLNLWILVKKWMKLLYSHILINFFSLFVFCNTDSCDPMFNFPLE